VLYLDTQVGQNLTNGIGRCFVGNEQEAAQRHASSDYEQASNRGKITSVESSG
jgi:hypothetical protein